MDYKNLKAKTIFDFTEDTKLLKDICGFGEDWFDKSEYIDLCSNTPIRNYEDLSQLAKLMKDDNLLKEVRHQFEKYVDKEFNQ